MPKLILPALRERNRYLAFEILSESKAGRGDVVKLSWNSTLCFLGELGASKTSLWVMDWDDKSQKGILKVNHKAVDEVRAALALVKELNGKPAVFHVLGVSGTLKNAREKYLKSELAGDITEN